MKLDGVKARLDYDERELLKQVRHDLFNLEEQPQSIETLESITRRLYRAADMFMLATEED